MARIFVSHSSRDNASASDIKSWLDGLGFEAPFLDTDKVTGIPPGADWERTLYRELERADAVIIILTANWMASQWCFAEFTGARALGKPIYPIIEAPAGDRLVAQDIQHLDLMTDRKGGLDRLRRELDRIVSDIRRGYRFKRGRPPYPGLVAFDEDDAAIYFGRDTEIRRLTELLRAQRSSGSGNVFIVLGASGSGKSSFLRAGILPRLKQETPAWTVLPSCRFKNRPIDGLALVFALALGESSDPAQWRRRLIEEPEAAIADLELHLKVKAQVNETHIVVPIDQFEELFTLASPTDAEAAWRVLNLLSKRTDTFVLLLTFRSDFMDRLQSVKDRAFEYIPFPLDPLPVGCIPDVIQNPGKVVNLRIDDSFVSSAMRDVGTNCALPLLAFALREIYELKGQQGHWTSADYEALGDRDGRLNPIENAVRRAAEIVMTKARSRGEDKSIVRRGFVPHLVRVSDAGSYIRQPCRRSDLDPAVSTFIDDLITARLLTAWEEQGEGFVEVAHEAIFTTWPMLKEVLDEDKDFLIGREQLKRDLEEWSRASEQEKSQALLMGLKLQRAAGWLKARANQLTKSEQRFVEESIQAAKAEENKKRNRRLQLAGIAFALVAVVPVTAFWISSAYQQAAAERDRANGASLASQSTLALGAGQLAPALEFGARAVRVHRDFVTQSALLQAVIATPGTLNATLKTGLRPRYAVWNRDASRVFAIGEDGLGSWRVSGGEGPRFSIVTSGVEYDPKGKRHGPVAMTTDRDNTLIIVASDGRILRLDQSGKHGAAAKLEDIDNLYKASIDADSGIVVAASNASREPAIFDRGGRRMAINIAGCADNAFVSAVAVQPGGSTVVVGYEDGRICRVSVRGGVQNVTQPLKEAIAEIAIARDTNLVAFQTAEGSIAVAKPDLSDVQVLATGNPPGAALSWSHDSAFLAAACSQSSICVWRVNPTGQPQQKPVQEAQFKATVGLPRAISWAPNDHRLVSADSDGVLGLWTPVLYDKTAYTRSFGSAGLTSIAVSSDGTLVAAGDESGALHLWNPETDQSEILSDESARDDTVVAVAWHDSRPWLAAATRRGMVHITSLPDRKIRSRQFSAGSAAVLRWTDAALAVGGIIDGHVRLWSTENPDSVRELSPPDGRKSQDIQGMVYDAQQTRLITTGALGLVLAWNLRSGGNVTVFEEVTAPTGHAQARSVLALVPKSPRLVVAGNDGQLLIYNLSSGRVEQRLKANGNETDAAALSDDGSILVTFYKENGRIDLWDMAEVAKGTPGPFAWFSVESPPRAVAYLPRAKAFAVATAAGKLVIFSADPKAWLRRAEDVSVGDR